MSEIKNAIISDVALTNSDHGCLSAWLYLDYGGSSQGFGGYALYGGAQHWKKPDIQYAGHFIWRCLEIGEVTEWSKLPGKTVRARIDNGLIEAIGHIVKNDWFCPREDFKK